MWKGKQGGRGGEGYREREAKDGGNQSEKRVLPSETVGTSRY